MAGAVGAGYHCTRWLPERRWLPYLNLVHVLLFIGAVSDSATARHCGSVCVLAYISAQKFCDMIIWFFYLMIWFQRQLQIWYAYYLHILLYLDLYLLLISQLKNCIWLWRNICLTHLLPQAHVCAHNVCSRIPKTSMCSRRASFAQYHHQ